MQTKEQFCVIFNLLTSGVKMVISGKMVKVAGFLSVLAKRAHFIFIKPFFSLLVTKTFSFPFFFTLLKVIVFFLMSKLTANFTGVSFPLRMSLVFLAVLLPHLPFLQRCMELLLFLLKPMAVI